MSRSPAIYVRSDVSYQIQPQYERRSCSKVITPSQQQQVTRMSTTSTRNVKRFVHVLLRRILASSGINLSL